MHSFTLDQLQSFDEQARQQDNPHLYLQLLSPLHDQWHRVARRVGFLLFHWHVVGHYRALGLDQQMGVTGYAASDFDPGGDFAQAGWTASMGSVGDSQSLDELIDYSRAIEGWHNEAHMVVGMVSGVDLMNPLTNVFLPQFWNLHLFINARFDEQLASYAQAVHPELQGPDAIVEHVEAEHPAVITRI
jgi:hypothetical protein